jgi:hypothetical protein
LRFRNWNSQKMHHREGMENKISLDNTVIGAIEGRVYIIVD